MQLDFFNSFLKLLDFKLDFSSKIVSSIGIFFRIIILIFKARIWAIDFRIKISINWILTWVNNSLHLDIKAPYKAPTAFSPALLVSKLL